MTMSYKKKKEKYKRLGLKYFLFHIGFLRIGLGTGLFCLLLYYFQSIDFNVQNFKFEIFLYRYLAWWPMAFLIGIITSYIMWIIDIDK